MKVEHRRPAHCNENTAMKTASISAAAQNVKLTWMLNFDSIDIE